MTKWISFPDEKLVVSGLPWFEENSPEVWRLPGCLKDKVRPEVWELATNPSGGRIRFRSDATTLVVRLNYDSINKDAHNMCPIGHSGVAVYVDGSFMSVVWPRVAGLVETVVFEGIARARRDYTLYLPIYHDVDVLGIGLDRDAAVSAPPPFAVAKPVAFYGSSITQGGCASQAGMPYQAIMGRMLNIDFVNLGFSGEGRGEPELARAFAEIDASCFVLDFAQNCRTLTEMRSSYVPFIMTIRGKHPEAPIVCISPIWSTWERCMGGTYRRNKAMRAIVHEAIAARKAAGDDSISLVEGTDLIHPEEGDCFVDGVHPNDLGFQRMAERLAPAIVKALGLDKGRAGARRGARRREITGEF